MFFFFFVFYIFWARRGAARRGAARRGAARGGAACGWLFHAKGQRAGARQDPKGRTAHEAMRRSRMCSDHFNALHKPMFCVRLLPEPCFVL